MWINICTTKIPVICNFAKKNALLSKGFKVSSLKQQTYLFCYLNDILLLVTMYFRCLYDIII